jgi:hypothetical protein
MRQRLIAYALKRVASAPGIQACALVDGASGMVWQTSGESEDMDAMWEAAVDYWRMYARLQGSFAPIGELRAAVLHHLKGVLSILPCRGSSKLVVVCLASHQGVDWTDCQRRVRELSRHVDAALIN